MLGDFVIIIIFMVVLAYVGGRWIPYSMYMFEGCLSAVGIIIMIENSLCLTDLCDADAR
jgi:hypothetical protein